MAEYGEREIERDVQAKALNAPRIAARDLDVKIRGEQFYVFPGTTVTVCCLTLANGYAVIGQSASASAENFDEEIGRKIARADARDKIWPLEGYLLRERLADAQE